MYEATRVPQEVVAALKKDLPHCDFGEAAWLVRFPDGTSGLLSNTDLDSAYEFADGAEEIARLRQAKQELRDVVELCYSWFRDSNGPREKACREVLAKYPKEEIP